MLDSSSKLTSHLRICTSHHFLWRTPISRSPAPPVQGTPAPPIWPVGVEKWRGHEKGNLEDNFVIIYNSSRQEMKYSNKQFSIHPPSLSSPWLPPPEWKSCEVWYYNANLQRWLHVLWNHILFIVIKLRKETCSALLQGGAMEQVCDSCDVSLGSSTFLTIW